MVEIEGIIFYVFITIPFVFTQSFSPIQTITRGGSETFSLPIDSVSILAGKIGNDCGRFKTAFAVNGKTQLSTSGNSCNWVQQWIPYVVITRALRGRTFSIGNIFHTSEPRSVIVTSSALMQWQLFSLPLENYELKSASSGKTVSVNHLERDDTCVGVNNESGDEFPITLFISGHQPIPEKVTLTAKRGWSVMCLSQQWLIYEKDTIPLNDSLLQERSIEMLGSNDFVYQVFHLPLKLEDTRLPTAVPSASPTDPPPNTDTALPINAETTQPSATQTDLPLNIETVSPINTYIISPSSTKTDPPLNTETVPPVNTETTSPLNTETTTPSTTQPVSPVNTETTIPTATYPDTGTTVPSNTQTHQPQTIQTAMPTTTTIIPPSTTQVTLPSTSPTTIPITAPSTSSRTPHPSTSAITHSTTHKTTPKSMLTTTRATLHTSMTMPSVIFSTTVPAEPATPPTPPATPPTIIPVVIFIVLVILILVGCFFGYWVVKKKKDEQTDKESRDATASVSVRRNTSDNDKPSYRQVSIHSYDEPQEFRSRSPSYVEPNEVRISSCIYEEVNFTPQFQPNETDSISDEAACEDGDGYLVPKLVC